MIVKYNGNDSYSSPVPPSNGTVVKKRGVVLCQISAVPKLFFGVIDHPLHSFLAPKSTVLQH